MTVKFVLSVSGAPTNPMVSGAKHRSMQQLINFVVRLVSGRYSGVSVTARNSAVAASSTVVFAGGLAVNDTVTINGQALTAKQKYARGVVTFASLQADDTVTVGATTFTAKVSPAGATQFALGANDAAAAVNLAAKINAHTTAGALVKAYSSGDTVIVRNLVIGTAGNNGGASEVAFSSSDGTRAAITGTTAGKLSGGAAVANNEFDYGNTTLEALTNFVAAVNASTTAIVTKHVSATSDGATTATLTALVPGHSGNAITLAKSAANINAVAARLTGGTETAAFSYSF